MANVRFTGKPGKAKDGTTYYTLRAEIDGSRSYVTVAHAKMPIFEAMGVPKQTLQRMRDGLTKLDAAIAADPNVSTKTPTAKVPPIFTV